MYIYIYIHITAITVGGNTLRDLSPRKSVTASEIAEGAEGCNDFAAFPGSEGGMILGGFPACVRTPEDNVFKVFFL